MVYHGIYFHKQFSRILKFFMVFQVLKKLSLSIVVLYTERKKKRIFWLSKHLVYYKNKLCLDTSNLYPLIPTIKFLNKFLYFLLMMHFTCNDVIAKYRHAPTIREGNQNSKTKKLSKKMDRWIIFCLKVVSLITNNDNSWSLFPVCNRFRWHEWKIPFLRLND